MTENEIFKQLHNECGKLSICNYNETGCGDCLVRQLFNKAEKALEEIQAYRAIGTIDEFKALKAKAEPQNWIAEYMGDGEFAWGCPSCKEYFALMEGTPQDNEYNYCPKCGQVLVEMKEGAT